MIMKTHLIIFAFALFAITACSSRIEMTGEEGARITIHASLEGATGTKTIVQEGALQVYWEPNEEIKVFLKGRSSRFVSINTDLASSTDFEGNIVGVVIGSEEGAGTNSILWGLYPYWSSATCDGSSVTTLLPASQIGRAGSFARNTHITLACSEGFNLSFYNVCGGLRFSLTQEGIKKVSFQANNKTAIAGKIKMTFEDGRPVVGAVSEGRSLITLTAPDGEAFQTGRWYYMEMIPGQLAGGFTMVFYKDNTSATISTGKTVAIKRGVYGSLSDVDKDLLFKDTPNSGESFISFADPIAKSACVERFDVNGDCEVSFEEAAAVTSLSGLFADWNTVTRFDEIKYFTGVSSTVGVFEGLSNLESIIIPDNITELGSFERCSSLKTVVLPSKITTLPKWCFVGCSSLTSIDLPSGITSIPFGCFADCKQLSTINWPANVEFIDTYAFLKCGFEGNNYSLTLPSSVTKIGRDAFYGLRHLILPAPNVVSIDESAFSISYTFLYVPAELVDSYKTSPNWSVYAERIRPIEDYPADLTVGGIVGEAVDLGLSVKWASWNVGASSPEGLGAYFAWGETEQKWDYSEKTYKWCNGSLYTSLSKYNTDSYYGTVDDKTELYPEDDAATAHWGGSWRMPTKKELNEIQSNCAWEPTSLNGVEGFKVFGKKEGYTDKWIFLPKAGNRFGIDLSYVGVDGHYASASLSGSMEVLHIRFHMNERINGLHFRDRGFSVRPVTE